MPQLTEPEFKVSINLKNKLTQTYNQYDDLMKL